MLQISLRKHVTCLRSISSLSTVFGIWTVWNSEYVAILSVPSISLTVRQQRALDYLADPSLIPTFPDEILYALTLSQLPKHDDSLAIAYYLTAAPPLATEKVQRAFFEVMCRSNITEAFYFTRKYDEYHRRRFFEQLVEFVHKTGAGQTRSKRAMELVGLPLDEDEEGWFEEALLQGNASSLPGAKDTIMMRRLAIGQMDGLGAELETLGGKKVDGLNWDDLRESMRHTQTIYPE
jgi:hypothetical protein